MHDNAIVTFWWFVFDLVGRAKNKTPHKQLIINGSKYLWEQSNLTNTYCNKKSTYSVP